MAFLSSFRIGQQTVYPEELHERLKSFALLENVGDAALRNLLAEANWFALPGGTLLDRDGENNAALFLVITGSLGVFVSDEQGQRQLVAHIPAGETVGEMSLIAGSSHHSAQLVALRDTELLRISPDGFEALIARHPRVMMNLMQMLVKRLKEANRGRFNKARPKTFAIVPLQEGLSEVPIAQRLASALAGMGIRAAVLDSNAGDQTAEWFNSFEQAHDVVFYRGDAPDSPWTHLCLRQADRIFLLARANQPLPLAPLDLPAFKERASGLPELLLLHPDGASAVLPEHFSVRGGLFQSHYHLRAGHQADVARVARFIAGRAVGLVLAGGGARGFAHIGIIK
ncbi:MAG TPA: cyclic nucleotide-binding and patatin-like phospholipase domain-containing protein, partial [Rhizomicrobium sp.]|nr:cyclic nucleotide-binding and patatin-like phospholipase domain-containing protein [Rhizomicrobium sp.]